MSHGDNSPDVGLAKMLLPQYKNTIESSEGRTASRLANNQSSGSQKHGGRASRNRPKTQERKHRVPPRHIVTKAIRLKECALPSKDAQNVNHLNYASQPVEYNNAIGDLMQNPHYYKLQDQPVSPANLPVVEPPSPARSNISPAPNKDAAYFEEESSVHGSHVKASAKGKFRLGSGTFDKMSALREDTTSPESPAFPL